jgi:flagellar biosynthetic protein FliR
VVDVFGLSAAQFETFILVFARVAAMLQLFPIFSAQQVPRVARMGLAAAISFIVYRAVPVVHEPLSLYALGLSVAAQVALGVILGFIASLVFTAMQFAGELVDLQIGFAVANVINPLMQSTVTIIGELQLALASIIYLASDSHLLLLQGIAGSFQLVPLPYIALPMGVAGDVVGFFSSVLLDVLRIVAPVVFALFLANVALAFMARVAPQMNVFVVGFPVQIGIGLVVLAMSLPLAATLLPDAFTEAARQMDAVMRAMRF